MADLLTLRELYLWTTDATGLTEDQTADDEKASEVISKVSQMACFLGGHDGTTADRSPEWDLEPGETKAPFDVIMVVLKVAKRSYENTRQVIQEGGLGPIGGDRVADAAALLLDLTDAERAVLTKYNPEGDVDEGGALWIQPTANDTDLAATDAVIYVGDDGQIAIGDGREWKIPLFSPGDPGDPNLYD